MRYDIPIYMQTITQGAYDAHTGDYGESVVEEVKLYANIQETNTASLQLVYGGLKQGSLTIRLQNHYDKPFARIRIGEKVYKADQIKRHLTKMSIIVSEVL